MDDWTELLKFTPLLLLIFLRWARRRKRPADAGTTAAAEQPTATRSDEIEFRRDYEPLEPR